MSATDSRFLSQAHCSGAGGGGLSVGEWRVVERATPTNAAQAYYFEHLKNSKFKERLSLNSPYLPKDRFSTRNSVAINLLPGSFTN